jgi:hypothetical protein
VRMEPSGRIGASNELLGVCACIPVARWGRGLLCVRLFCGRAPIEHTSPERAMALGWNPLYHAERHPTMLLPVTDTGNVEMPREVI